MKNKITTLICLGITIVMLSSCAASRSRYGCPTAAVKPATGVAVVHSSK